jgi:prophage antirepressor-like protein
MQINKFTKSDFGTLTTLTSDKTGVVMFLAPEIGKMWGHSNMRQVVNRILNESEYKVITKSKHPEFFKELVSNKLLPSKAQRIQLITESAVYKLALASNLEKAKPFRDWVTSEVLPSIRKNGYYSIANQSEAILIHTNTSVQKQNSKDVNKKHFIEQGIESVIEHNRQSMLLHTGKTPPQWKKIGKEQGLKSKETSSGKEVLRHIQPEIACAMSFTDSLVSKGFDLKTVSELSLKAAVPLFQGMIELGITPLELKK